MRALLALLVLAGVAACSGPPAPSSPVAVATAHTDGDPRLEAAVLAARGDWTGAVERYRAGLERNPEDLGLHFALGSALSHLDRVADAAEQFSWVVAHGKPGQPEVVSAAQWLEQFAGPSDAPRARDASAAEGVREAPTGARLAGDDEMKAAYGTLKGKTAWPGITKESLLRLDIRLRGDDEATARVSLPLHILLGQPFTMQKVPAGAYRLVAKARGRELWERRVIVEPWKDTVVDLTPETSSVPVNDFPPR